MSDIVTFNRFIAPDVLIFFYYIGAIFVPVLLWVSKDYFIAKLPWLQTLFAKKQSIYVIVLFIVVFLFMELFWRLMFEAMIGYFDMHNYLYEISKRV